MNLGRFALLVPICALSGCLTPEEAHEVGADQAPVEQVVQQQASEQQDQPNVVRYETEGNLESNNDIGCIPLSEVKNSYTPADMYRGVVACIEQGSVEDGTALFFMAGMYSRFDMNRIVDTSAHQAASMLIIQAFQPLSDEAKEPFSREMERVTQDPQALAAMCASISEVGAPDYHPRYIIQHGLNAVGFQDTAPDLVEGFDPVATWDALMSTYLHCPGA